MEKTGDRKNSKALRNYYTNLISLIPLLLLMFSGIVLLRYHGGEAYETISIGISGNNWLLAHRILALFVISLISIHLLQHSYWLQKLFSFRQKNKGKNNDMNVILFFVFILCAITGMVSWILFADKPMAELLREVHNKLGFALVLFFIVHLSNYFKWLANMTQKAFNKL